MRIIGTWWLQPNSPVCSTSWSHRQQWEAGSLLKGRQILMACISYLWQVPGHPRAGQAVGQAHICREPLQAWGLSGLWKQIKGITIPALWQQGDCKEQWLCPLSLLALLIPSPLLWASARETPSTGTTRCWFWFGPGVNMLTPYRLRDTSQKLQASRPKDWKKNIFGLNYLPKKSRILGRVETFLFSGFSKGSSFIWCSKTAKNSNSWGAGASRVAAPHPQQGTWLFLLLSSNHAIPFLTVTQISFCWSARTGKFIMHWSSGRFSSFEKQTASTWLSFVGF